MKPSILCFSMLSSICNSSKVFLLKDKAIIILLCNRLHFTLNETPLFLNNKSTLLDNGNKVSLFLLLVKM
jgi:hypothetical protein